MFWEGEVLPGKDVVPFAGVMCLTHCCRALKEGSSLLLGRCLYPLYCCSVNKDLPLCIGGACASVRRAGRSAWPALGCRAKPTDFMQTLQDQEEHLPFDGVQHASALVFVPAAAQALGNPHRKVTH